MQVNLTKWAQERLFTRTIGISILMFFLGLGLFSVETTDPKYIGIINSLSGALITSAIFSVIWDYFSKRAFLDEIMIRNELSYDIEKSGVLHVYKTFKTQAIDWDDLFNHSKKLYIFFRYGQYWRGMHEERLQQLVKKKSSKIRLILPNPKNEKVMQEIADRTGKEPEEIQNKIIETKNKFLQLDSKKSAVKIYFVDENPMFTYYIFENKIVLAFFTHTTIKGTVPTFIIEKKGFLGKFITNDFENLLNEATNVE